jgi:hypothetical protein
MLRGIVCLRMPLQQSRNYSVWVNTSAVLSRVAVAMETREAQAIFQLTRNIFRAALFLVVQLPSKPKRVRRFVILSLHHILWTAVVKSEDRVVQI